MGLLLFLVAILVLNSCNIGQKSDDDIIEKAVTERNELSMDSKIFLGNRLFTEKTCITCHALGEKKIGPSVVEIMDVYKEKNTNIEMFLRGNSKAIVDTNTIQVANMQDNINGFLKNVTDEELDAITTYMHYC